MLDIVSRPVGSWIEVQSTNRGRFEGGVSDHQLQGPRPRFCCTTSEPGGIRGSCLPCPKTTEQTSGQQLASCNFASHSVPLCELPRRVHYHYIKKPDRSWLWRMLPLNVNNGMRLRMCWKRHKLYLVSRWAFGAGQWAVGQSCPT